MQVIINEAEIKQAIREYVLTQVPMNPATKIDIDLKATRGEAGYQAFISIERPTKYDGTSKEASVPEKAAEKLLEDLDNTKTAEIKGPVLKPEQDALANQDEQPTEDRFEISANKQPLEIAKKVRAARKPKVVETVPAVDTTEATTEEAPFEVTDPSLPTPATHAEGPKTTAPKLFGNLAWVETVDEADAIAAMGGDEEQEAAEEALEAETGTKTSKEEPAAPKAAPVSLFGKPTATAIEPDVPAKAPVALFGNLRRTLN